MLFIRWFFFFFFFFISICYPCRQTQMAISFYLAFLVIEWRTLGQRSGIPIMFNKSWNGRTIKDNLEVDLTVGKSRNILCGIDPHTAIGIGWRVCHKCFRFKREKYVMHVLRQKWNTVGKISSY